MAELTPLEQYVAARDAVLNDRGAAYNPDGSDPHRQARLYQRIKAALYAEMPQDLPDGAEYYIDHLASKASRTLESSCAGIDHPDTPFDFGGYAELLRRLCAGKPL